MTTNDQDRIDAARWRALRPLLWVAGRNGQTWIESRRIAVDTDTVDEIVDKLVQIAQEKQP